MAYHYEKSTGDLVIDGWEKGIGTSPHKGLGNIQNANISTETGEVMASFGRVQQTDAGDTSTNHTLTGVASDLIFTNYAVKAGMWINVTASTITNLGTGNYYVIGSAAGVIALSTYYNSARISNFGSTGSATFHLMRSFGQPIAAATETYQTSNSTQYRYYVLDSQGLVWVRDTNVNDAITNPTINFWALPDFSINYFGSETAPSGIAILNGFLHVFSGKTIWTKSTSILGDTTSTSTNWVSFASGLMLSSATTTNPHFAYVGHQGSLYYTDGNFIGKIFPNTSLLSSTTNTQSYATYTHSSASSGKIGTLATLIGGSVPYSGGTRIPASFFASPDGTLPAALSASTIYYIDYSPGNGTFKVYAAITGDTDLDLDIDTSATGTQYFNTYQPQTAGGEATITFTQERLNLPFFEISQSMTEIGNLVMVGTKGNTIYPWDQVSSTPGDLIPLPENNTVYMITVNNMAYVFAGNKGNIYVTNGSTASLVISVPDYCAGIPGTTGSYIEPYFTWGGAAYIRGRVYFSILDQTSAKAGNCGGIWSFVPTQNFYIEQDFGLALRLENQNSYGTYSGVATVILSSQTQNAISPQYWSGWYSSTSSPAYGIDFTDTKPDTAATVETDLIPTGTQLDKKTFKQIEYKLSAPLVSTDAVAISWRVDGVSSYTALTNVQQDSATALSGYFPANFEKGQWLQLKITLTPVASSSSSFVRLKEVRVR